MTRNDTSAQLNLIWGALESYRETLIPEGDPDWDDEWSDICTAMEWITEDLCSLRITQILTS
jgi:hypothetical protein